MPLTFSKITVWNRVPYHFGKRIQISFAVQEVELHSAQVRVVPVLAALDAPAAEIQRQVLVAFLQQQLDSHVEHLTRFARLNEGHCCNIG